MNHRAVRTLRRVLRPYEMGEAMDYEFDYGEFSGPAHARAQLRVIEQVADRYGMTADQLEADYMAAAGWNEDCYYRTLDPKTIERGGN